MTSQDVRQRYLDYFQRRQHAVIERAQLVLQDDPTTLFTGSGMQPLLPYLLGETHPSGQRLVNSQICLRMQDIDEVGDSSHTTCFEMLGNWSLGDYFKQEQLSWFFHFLVDEIGLDINKLYVTCFRGDGHHNLAKDEQSATILQQLYEQKGLQAEIVDLKNSQHAAEVGMQSGRIFYYDDEENWWSRGGGISSTPLGDPAGGDCEFFYDFGLEYHDEQKYGQPHPASDSGRFLEIGNSVFMEYVKVEQGFSALKSKNVDFGGGLERIVAASINQADVFQTDLLKPLIDELIKWSSTTYQESTSQLRIIADHWRAATWLALDGVVPSNKEQGYVMRRLIRRSILKARELNLSQPLSQQLTPLICQTYASAYSQFESDRGHLVSVLSKEEKAFSQTLKSGLREFQKLTADGRLDGQTLFRLYDTYGFPKELSLEEASQHKLVIEPQIEADFNKLMTEQRQRSQTIKSGDFQGGLADHNPITIKYHTATHLMYKALRLVLGSDVIQRGSNINRDRLRFDFSYPNKLSEAQISQIEDIVNEQIDQGLPIDWQVRDTQEALNGGVLGAFGDKYGPQVKVYTVGNEQTGIYSQEICGGPHVENTAVLGEDGARFKIIKEQSSSAGIRRIKAVLTK